MSPFEVSWLRNDLISASSYGAENTRLSHGPGFRLIIQSGKVVKLSMSSRHSQFSKHLFIKNVVSVISSRWIGHCLEQIFNLNWKISVKWSDEWVDVFQLEDLQKLATDARKTKKVEFRKSMKYSHFIASKKLWSQHLENEEDLPYEIVHRFFDVGILFWAHHLQLNPRGHRKTATSTHQISREKLRKDILRIESKCQNLNCPHPGGDSKILKVAHLTPRINLLSNAIVLCSICYDEQFPATSVIRVRQQLDSPGQDLRAYSVEIATRDGPKMWHIVTHENHPLANPRVT